MKKTNRAILFQSELLWAVLIIGLIIITIIPIYSFTDISVQLYIAMFIALGVSFFKLIVFLRQLPYMKSFWVKMTFLVLNIPLFFFILKSYNWLTNEIELYTYSGLPHGASVFKEGMGYDTFRYLNSLILMSGIAALIMIGVLQFRIAFTVFKYKEVPFINNADTKSI